MRGVCLVALTLAVPAPASAQSDHICFVDRVSFWEDGVKIIFTQELGARFRRRGEDASRTVRVAPDRPRRLHPGDRLDLMGPHWGCTLRVARQEGRLGLLAEGADWPHDEPSAQYERFYPASRPR